MKLAQTRSTMSIRGIGKHPSTLTRVAAVLALLLAFAVAGGVASPAYIYAQQATPTPTAGAQAPRLFDPAHIKLPEGYRIEVAVANLSVPTTALFDGDDLLVAESGWVNTAPPRVVRIKPDGTMSVVASEGLAGPVTGLLVKDGQVYVSH
ncbi:MAG TPA: hypothetical protein VFG99_12220, partial [Chloroflexia bacterium]|nr:hypothetical protein [Chloroflexia bacterium]